MQPAQPAMEPAEPAMEPAQPVMEPAEPAMEPAQPVMEPAEPAMEPSVEPEMLPASPDEYYAAFADHPASIISSINIDPDGANAPDQNGDGVGDNALGGLLGQLGPLLGGADLNGTLQEAIDDGSLALGAIWTGLPNGVEDTTTSMHFFVLTDTDDNPVTRDAYTISTNNFQAGTGTPNVRVQGVNIAGGNASAGPIDFPLSVPLGGIQLDVTISQAQLDGIVADADPGIAFTDATLAGAVTLDSLFGALNGFLLSDTCECLGLEGDLIQNGACTAVPPGAMCDGDGDICKTIADACGIAVPIIGNQVDVDTDGDGMDDAISIFLNLDMDGTTITGVVPGE